MGELSERHCVLQVQKFSKMYCRPVWQCVPCRVLHYEQLSCWCATFILFSMLPCSQLWLQNFLIRKGWGLGGGGDTGSPCNFIVKKSKDKPPIFHYVSIASTYHTTPPRSCPGPTYGEVVLLNDQFPIGLWGQGTGPTFEVWVLDMVWLAHGTNPGNFLGTERQ
jgi:hypothetical protein